ncbi:MAG: exosortase C-terminal domain/associated protein EpsI, partial [Polymorphobacter sp.]
IPVMVVMAYGDLQSDALQLHRPEVCYTAVGFQISATSRAAVKLAPGASLPIRELTAESDTRIEPIVYWTRIGDDLPTSGREQRSMKLAQSMRGIIPDGILVRLSTVAEPSRATFESLAEFSRQMLWAMAPADRPALIGRPLANAMAAGKPSRA